MHYNNYIKLGVVNLKTYALVLAAGKGTRMKSNIPKCAFPILDKPIIEYVVERFEKSKYVDETILIVGYKKSIFTNIYLIV